MKVLRAVLPVGLLLTGSFLAVAQQAPSVASLARVPVKEVSIFKDGHAFFLHQGPMPVDSAGNIVMDYLPAPVLGTFWAYSADSRAVVAGLTAGQRRVVVERTALRLAELLDANIGAEVIVTEKPAAAREGLSYGRRSSAFRGVLLSRAICGQCRIPPRNRPSAAT
jgi:hypothetical protein